MATTTRFLDGIRVLDFTQYLAGPSCTRMLRDLGAEVIKVEQPPHGDPARAIHPRANRRSGFYAQQNRGKQSIGVDLSADAGQQVIRDLIPHVDVVVQNFSPGVLERRGLGYDDLRALRPDLIMASVSGFGQTGPLRDRPAFDFVVQAYTGVMHLTGEPDGAPSIVGIGLADSNAGVHAFGLLGHALFHRERTGEGCHLDISMSEALLHFHELAISAPSVDPEAVPARSGHHYDALAPGGAFQGPEGWIMVFVTVNQIDRFWTAIGREDLADDPRFRGNEERRAHRDELTAIVEEWMAGFDSDQAVIEHLVAHRVPVVPVQAPLDLVDDPQVVARGSIIEVDDPHLGSLRVPAFPARIDDRRPGHDEVAPDLGQHNEAVLVDVAGYDPDRIRALTEDGTLGTKDR